MEVGEYYCTPIGKSKYIVGGRGGLCVREREGGEGRKQKERGNKEKQTNLIRRGGRQGGDPNG